MFSTETVNNKQTGLFEFEINVENLPMDGKWMNLKKIKSLDVKFTKTVTCKSN